MKALLVALSCLTIALILYFFWPSNGLEEMDESTQDEMSAELVTEPRETAAASEEEEQKAEQERTRREAVYAELEKSRRNLDRSLSRLKAFLWNVRLPADEAEEINKELLSAYKLLKNKKLMGAFPSLAAMEDELKKVQYYHTKAKEITEQIKTLPKKEGG